MRNGYLPEREVQTGIGPISVKQPRVRNREGSTEDYLSAILPKYLRRVPSLDAVIPALYLRGKILLLLMLEKKDLRLLNFCKVHIICYINIRKIVKIEIFMTGA